MNKTKTIIICALAVVMLGVGGVTFALINQSASSAQSQQSANSSIEFTAESGKNVLSQLKSHFSVETQDTSYGPYVVAINGKKAGSNQFWVFYVNGQMSQKGAIDYITSGGEQIKWQLQ